MSSYEKAVWDSEAARVFCEICVDEVLAENRPTAFLNTAGYKNLCTQFKIRTGREYSKKQMKNRWDALKSVYVSWVHFRTQATGLGWNAETQTVTADADQWAVIIKQNKMVESFRKGPPDNLEMLEIMFAKAHVTGATSRMTGDTVSLEEGTDSRDVNVLDGSIPLDDNSPVAGSFASPSKKRARICGKKEKSDIQRLIDHLVKEDSTASTHSKNNINEIREIMTLVRECGAEETSNEYRMVTRLFAKASNRYFFKEMRTNEGRLNWLSRMYEERMFL